MRWVVRIGVLVAVLALIVLALPFVLSQEGVRDRLTAQVRTLTGLELTLGGDLGITLYPDIGLRAEQVSLSSGTSGMGIPDVALGSVRFAMPLGALITGEIKVRELIFVEPVIRLNDGQDAAAAPTQQNTQGAAPQEQDVGALLGTLSLERLSVDNGTVIGADGITIASAINAELAVPGLDEPLLGNLQARLQDLGLSLDLETQTLRGLINGAATPISLNAQLDQPPHPALQDIALRGTLTRTPDRVALSDATLNTQALDVGLAIVVWLEERTRIDASALIPSLNLAEFASASEGSDQTAEQGGAPSEAAPLDLTALAGFDANVKLEIGDLIADPVRLQNVQMQTTLQQGRMLFQLSPTSIAGGSLALTTESDIRTINPVVFGQLQAQQLALTSLAALAQQDFPATGQLNAALDYGFQGIAATEVMRTLNLRGTVALADGVVSQTGLGSALGDPNAESITGINISSSIASLDQPVRVTGDALWKGRSHAIDATVSPLELANNARGPIAVSLNNGLMQLALDGMLDLAGSYAGTVNFNTASLDALTRFATGGEAPDQPLALQGQVTANASSATLDLARLSYAGMSGSASLGAGWAQGTQINGQVTLDVLDLNALTGGDSSSAQSNGGAATSSASTDTPLDTRFLQTINADLTVNAGRIRFGQAETGQGANPDGCC